VMMETYQGVGPDFAPNEYVRQLAAWCKKHQIVLTFDEVQAGFGRTGKFWAFEHYGLTPDIICCGKGISSSLPLSAVIGRAEIMDQFPPGSMTSTHTGNPVCCAAAMAAIRKILREKMTENAAALEPVLLAGLQKIQAQYPEVIGHVTAKGLVAGMQTVKPGTKDPDHDLAHRIIELCYQRGLLLFAPVGAWGQTVKIAPPLSIPKDALQEGLAVLEAATAQAISELVAEEVLQAA
jgi:4-aminobutyrate aminotransferase/(S)-3-amino-2-methylpropionate transaminase